MTTKIKQIVNSKEKYKEVELKGWVRNNRAQKSFGFLMLNDGSAFETLQIVYDDTLKNFSDVQKYRSGSSVWYRVV